MRNSEKIYKHFKLKIATSVFPRKFLQDCDTNFKDGAQVLDKQQPCRMMFTHVALQIHSGSKQVVEPGWCIQAKLLFHCCPDFVSQSLQEFLNQPALMRKKNYFQQRLHLKLTET